MKKIKKVVVGVFALASLGSLAACKKDETSPYDVDAAAKRVMLTQDKSTAVVSEFDIPRTVVFNDISYNVEWSSNNDYAKKLRNKIEVFVNNMNRKNNIQLVLVSSYGLKKNMYSNMINKVITIDDLF